VRGVQRPVVSHCDMPFDSRQGSAMRKAYAGRWGFERNAVREEDHGHTHATRSRPGHFQQGIGGEPLPLARIALKKELIEEYEDLLPKLKLAILKSIAETLHVEKPRVVRLKKIAGGR
jgi:hypothetical protein